MLDVSVLFQQALEETQTIETKGRVVEIVGTIVKAMVPEVRIGEICILRDPGSGQEVQAEVVGFAKQMALLTPLGDLYGLSPHTEVVVTGRALMVPVGPSLLGRVLDGSGRLLDVDTRGPLEPETFYPVYADPPNPLTRKIISEPLPLGIRALDGLITCGVGQRMGIFAAAGGSPKGQRWM